MAILTSDLGKVMEQMLLEATLKHMKDEKVLRGKQHGFTKKRSCLPRFIAFCDGVPDIENKGRKRDVECLDFCKAFDTVSYSLLVITLMRYGLDQWGEKLAGLSGSKSCEQ